MDESLGDILYSTFLETIWVSFPPSPEVFELQSPNAADVLVNSLSCSQALSHVLQLASALFHWTNLLHRG